jgi:hypothetical protein
MRCILLLAGILAALPLAARGAEDFEDSVDAAPGGRLRVEVDAGDVEIEGHDRDEISVDGRASGIGASGVEFELEEAEDGRAALLSVDLGGLSAVFGGPRVRLHVRVPHRTALDVRTGGGDVEIEEVDGPVRARTSGGKVEVSRIRAAVDLETSGGEIRADEIGGDLRARTSGGEIQASEVRGVLDVRTSGGPLKLIDVGGPVHGRTSGGSVDVRFTGAPEGELETSGGSIEVEFAAGSGLRLDARTSGGRVELDRELRVRGRLDPSRVEAELNGGGPPLRLRTSGGNIVIRTR